MRSLTFALGHCFFRYSESRKIFCLRPYRESEIRVFAENERADLPHDATFASEWTWIVGHRVDERFDDFDYMVEKEIPSDGGE